ncbi:EXS-domain-containing protein, partial [Rozella allomycis CSF55]
RILFSPFTRVYFADFFLADQLCSISSSLRVLSRAICLAQTNRDDPANPICQLHKSWFGFLLIGLPAYWRLMQCLRRYYDTRKAFPHLANGLKYAVALIVVFFTALKKTDDFQDNYIINILFILFSSLASLYSYIWDVTMDWGLFKPSSKNFMLRDNLMYSWTWFYYWALISNMILRAAWVF